MYLDTSRELTISVSRNIAQKTVFRFSMKNDEIQIIMKAVKCYFFKNIK
jgi:hypothetical protein